MLLIDSLNDFLRKMKYSAALPATFLTPQFNSLGCSCQSRIMFNSEMSGGKFKCKGHLAKVVVN